jgi:hypothetical protein
VSVCALLALLITWIVTSGGGGGKKDDGANGQTPAPTISAGPSSSGPAISQAPGGRDESSPGASSGSDSGGGSGSAGSDGSGSGGSGGSDGSAGGSAGGGASTGVGRNDTVAAGSTLPDCTASAVKLTVRSLHNTYEPGQAPTLLVTAANSSGLDCKVDLGPKKAVLTISQASGSDDHYWSSADCPGNAGSLVFRAPARSSITYSVKWDRKPSAPQCATPPAGSAGQGTYLVELTESGFASAQTSFVLSAD